MYFRARYYDPATGEFISRDPLGYVDGMSLYRGYFVPGGVDPSGLHWPSGLEHKDEPHYRDLLIGSLCKSLKKSNNGQIKISRSTMWHIIQTEKGYSKFHPAVWDPRDKIYGVIPWPTYRKTDPWDNFQRGCVGVTSCLLGGRADYIPGAGNPNCFSTLAAAKKRASEMKEMELCECPKKPVVIGKTVNTGYYDFGFYVEECGAFFHAENGFMTFQNTEALFSTSEKFHDHGNAPGAGWTTQYCATCESDEY